MQTITIEIELPRDLLVSLDIPMAQAGQKTKEWVVLELFREGKISSCKAGELLGIRKVEFIDLLGRYAIPYLDQPPAELASDVQSATDAAREANER